MVMNTIRPSRSLRRVSAGRAQKLQTLPHPNIVRVIDCDRDGRIGVQTMGT